MDYIELAQDCAESIYDTKPPNPKYVACTRDLLLGTAATESGFKARRQNNYTLVEIEGAWGLWQIEKNSVIDSLRVLKLRPALRENAANFLVGHDNIDGLLATSSECVLRLMHSWDRLAILMARLHYFKFRAPIPEGLQAQAEYYKIYFNTMAGKGSVEKYLRDWRTYVKL